MTSLRVLAALSGGVDSATAATRAVDAGHDVTAVHLALSANPSSYRTGARGCCTLEDARDARRAADVIGVPFYVWDMAERFHHDVVEDFVAEYAAGRTPNPCVRCNEKIKFAAVLDRAMALGFDAVCTGHHCTLEDARDARRAADVIGVPFYVWDMAERFHHDVVDDFVAEYAAGRTPNPCVRCNEKIKFAAVLDRALALGFDAVCTGHHARLEGGLLRRSVDLGKDQSYVLAVLTRDQLAHAMFPLGDTTKAEVRREAAERGLAVADKPDSHDVCFIADGDTRGFLAKQLGTSPGPIVDSSGQRIGSHDGAYAFTVGQRRGLRLDHPAPDGRPRYVLSIEPVSRTVTVGPGEELEVREIAAQRPVWTGCEPLTEPRDCLVQLRAHGEVYPGQGRLDGDTLQISLTEPARGVASGQTAVLYDGDTVLASATITATRVAAPA